MTEMMIPQQVHQPLTKPAQVLGMTVILSDHGPSRSAEVDRRFMQAMSSINKALNDDRHHSHAGVNEDQLFALAYSRT